MSHLTNDNRNTIPLMLAHERKLQRYSEANGSNPTSISKEIKNNQIISNPSKLNSKILCKKLDRFPYVCGTCPKKYTTCTLRKTKHKLSYGIYINKNFIPLFYDFMSVYRRLKARLIVKTRTKSEPYPKSWTTGGGVRFRQSGGFTRFAQTIKTARSFPLAVHNYTVIFLKISQKTCRTQLFLKNYLNERLILTPNSK